MAKYGKWIGAGLGFALGGPLGALLGMFIGSALDNVQIINPAQSDYNPYKHENPSIYGGRGDFMFSLTVLATAVCCFWKELMSP